MVIAAVGRLKPGPLRMLVDEYVGRLGWPVAEREVAVSRAGDPATRAAREADLLLAAVPDAAALVSLDPDGVSLSSEAFAALLDRLMGERRCVAFAIGGPDGHGPAVTAAADRRLALGPMVWPHGLARVMLAEQLWRAYAILSGHPYHRAD
jgi:23S rRNA (pseudouridine1915-N3)-methyltransferase